MWGIYFSSWAWLGSSEESPLAVHRLLLIKGSCDTKGQPFPIPEALSWCFQFTSLTGHEILWFFAVFVWGSVLFCGESRPTTVSHLLGLLRDFRNKTDWGSALSQGWNKCIGTRTWHDISWYFQESWFCISRILIIQQEKNDVIIGTKGSLFAQLKSYLSQLQAA